MVNLTIISPAMLKLFSECPRKFHFCYSENISKPVLDLQFITGKNIHALASYFLNGENISKFEKALSSNELDYWQYLKTIKYFSFNIVGVERTLNFKLNSFWFGGRIDAVVEQNNDYFILDYKTGGINSDMTFDFQTIIYLLACDKLFKNYNSLTFVYIDLKNKKEIPIKFSQELKQKYEEKLIIICNQINKFDNKKFIKSANCSCEYSKLCGL